ncbi:MAG: DUF2339 domain-containing protein, partial [Verrucomicrobiota bacterium]
LGCFALAGFIVVVFADGADVLGESAPFTWFNTTVAMLAIGLAVTLIAPAGGMLFGFGLFLLLAVPLKLFLDLLVTWSSYESTYDLFLNPIFLPYMVFVIVLAGWTGLIVRRHPEAAVGRFDASIALYLLSIGSLIALATLEIARGDGRWVHPSITLWWGVSGSLLVFFGVRLRRRYLRLLALVVFAFTVLKIFIFDLSTLQGLQRIAAFIGIGLLLLIVSFAYQKITPILMGEEKKDE